MIDLLEQLIAGAWNRLSPHESSGAPSSNAILLGHLVTESGAAGAPVGLPRAKRAEHMLVLGRTGSGKSSLLRHLAAQDVRHDDGFVQIDLHGDATPAVLRLLAAEEQRRHVDLSDRVIVLEPADPEWAVGFNVLEAPSDAQRFVYIAEDTHLPWGINKDVLYVRFAQIQEYSTWWYPEPIRRTSGYRCPHHNAALPNAAQNSRHLYGDALDMTPPLTYYSPPNQTEYNRLRSSAVQAQPSYITDWSTYADRHLHVDWRP